MELEIPQGEIIDNNLSLKVVDDLDEIVALWAANKVCGYLGERVGRYDGEMIDVRLKIDGYESDITFYVLELPRPTVVVAMVWEGKMCYALFRDAGTHWLLCTKLLLLPSADEVPEWGDAEESFVQSLSRVLLFAGLASVNGWYERLTRSK
jgi:hypothetical protein